MAEEDYDEKRRQEAMSLEEYNLLKVGYAKVTDMGRKIAVSREAYQMKNELGIASKEEVELLEKLVKLIEDYEKFKLSLENSIRNSGNLLIN